MTIPCDHSHKLPNGQKISAIVSVTPQIVAEWDKENQIGAVFLIKEKICVVCGKATQINCHSLFKLAVVPQNKKGA